MTAAECEKRGVHLVAHTAERAHGVRAHDARTRSLVAGQHRRSLCGCPRGLGLEDVDPASGLEARERGLTRVESGDRLDHGGRCGQLEDLAQRLEAPLGTVDADRDAREHVHTRTLAPA